MLVLKLIPKSHRTVHLSQRAIRAIFVPILQGRLFNAYEMSLMWSIRLERYSSIDSSRVEGVNKTQLERVSRVDQNYTFQIASICFIVIILWGQDMFMESS